MTHFTLRDNVPINKLKEFPTMTRYLLIFIFLLNIPLISANADEEKAQVAGISTQDLTPFNPTDDIMRDVDDTLVRAKKKGKLAMFVMGANWCHDSIGLAHHFSHPDIAKLVADRYETIFVDVGFLDKSFEVIKRFGTPVIYGTPTVIIVDPENNNVVNRNDMHTWRDAYKMSLFEVGQYFRNMAKPEARELEEMPAETLMALYARIDAFEEYQAKRIYKGFSIVGPILASKDRSKEAMQKWVALSKFRYKITEDLADLRTKARESVLAGETDISLEFPEYVAFEWEE